MLLGNEMKRFNTTGTCFPDIHYLADITPQLDEAVRLVERGDYCCIHRGRQYGKTTTLSLLKSRLEALHKSVFFISFEGLGENDFSSDEVLYASFFKLLQATITYDENRLLTDQAKAVIAKYSTLSAIPALEFSAAITELVLSNQVPVVLLVDEVDQAGNHASFLHFLGTLRDKYLKRQTRATFLSVILSGVHDVKNLKLKICSDERHQYNSPWNIAISFKADMSLRSEAIADMLRDYASEHTIQMDYATMSTILFDFTSGYPYLVSRIAQIIDENELTWDKDGFLIALKMLYRESNTLFDDLRKKLAEYPKLYSMLRDILIEGKSYTFNQYEEVTNIAAAFSLIREQEGKVQVSCRIFETWLYELFLSEEENKSCPIYKEGSIDKQEVIVNKELNMPLILENFVHHYNSIYTKRDERFVEEQGRKLFLLYLRPIINGTGNYYIESRTRDNTRTDVIIDYWGKQYIVELKIWRGEQYHTEGEKQLCQYLDLHNQSIGYMLTFSFNKHKEIGVTQKYIDNKNIFEATA